MSSLEQIVRRVSPDYKPCDRYERVLFMVDGRLTETPGWWQQAFGTVEGWAVNLNPRVMQGIGGVLRSEEVSFPRGEIGLVDVHYSRLRVIAGDEAKLVFAAARGGRLEELIMESVSNALPQMDSPSPGSWRRIKSRVEQLSRRLLAESSGITMHLEIQPARQRGRSHHETTKWSLGIGRVEEPQSLCVDLVTDDDPNRLPLSVPGTSVVDELALVRDVLDELCARLTLEDFHRKPTAIRDAASVAVAKALEPHARRVVALKLRLELGLERQRRVRVSFDVHAGARDLQLDLDLLLERNDADEARNFELQAPEGIELTITTRAREIAERRFAGESLDVLFEQNQDLLDATRDEIGAWVEATTGYRIHHSRLELATSAPTPARRVRLTANLPVTLISGGRLEMEVRATFELRDSSQWLRRGAPDVEELWTEETSDLIHAAVHTLDESETIRTKSDLESKVRHILKTLSQRDGYELDAVRVQLGDVVPLADRSLEASARQAFYVGSAGDEVRLGLAANLEITDEWSYAAWKGGHARGWQTELLTAVASNELEFRTRQQVRLDPKAIEAAIRSRYELEAARRGYRVGPFRVEGLEFAPAADYLRTSLSVSAMLPPGDDRATWSGLVEISLAEPSKWVACGEPDPSACLPEWAETAFVAACRKSPPGEIDNEPDTLVARFRDVFATICARAGYEINGLDGTVVADNQPPRYYNCTVSHRSGAKQQARLTLSPSSKP